MTASCVSGIIGSAIVWLLGSRAFDLSPAALIRLCAVANLAGLLAITITVRAERIAWMKRNVLKGGVATWTLLSTIFLSVLCALSPEYREWKVAAVLTFPLIFAAGFSFPVFGWFQDRYVRRARRR